MSKPHTPTRLALFWQRRPFLITSLAIAIVLTAFFGVRTLTFYAGLHKPAPHIVEPWMRPRYIARAFDLDRDDVFEAIGVIDDDDPLRRLSLAQIARRTDTDVDDLVSALEALIAERGASDRQ